MIYCFFLIQEHTDPVKNALSAVDRYEVKKTNVVKFAESARSNFDASKSASAIGHDRQARRKHRSHRPRRARQREQKHLEGNRQLEGKRRKLRKKPRPGS
jgi:hypothetical protein